MIILCIILAITCYFDYRWGKIPNWLVGTALLAGMIRMALYDGLLGEFGFIFRAVTVILVFYPLFRIGTIGAGDLKLFGVCCGVLPKERVLYFLFFALLFAGVHSFICFTRREDVIERFSYLFAYIKEVAGSGKWMLYWRNEGDRKRASVCLAGPILLSMIMYVGGLY